MTGFFVKSIFSALFILSMLVNCNENPFPDGPGETTWGPITEDVNGILSTIENMRVLKLYGSHYEMGYAHGYLLGPEILERQESNLAKEGVLNLYENQVLPNIQQVHFPQEYHEEIRGQFEGVKARTTNGIVYSAVLGREVDFNDALALNCLSTFASREMCSSFSAWGRMTQNSEVLTAYNHDCKTSLGYTGNWYIIVRVPDEGSGAIPTICAGLAGDMNVHTTMNSKGITLACQGIDLHNAPTSTTDFTPEGIIFRKLIEYVDADSPLDGIKNILNVLYTVESEALMMSWPNSVSNTHSAAVEIDGNLSQNHGYSLRYPDNHNSYIIQTNSFWLRYPLQPCQRYDNIASRMESISAGNEPPFTIDSAWQLLSEARIGGDFLTEIAVVFEPVKKRMHVAFAEPGTNAHECNRITLNIEELIRIQ
jgi:hypothetical protein